MNTDLLAGIIVTALLVLALAITLGSLFADRTPAPAPYTSPSDRLRPMRNNATAECNVAAQGQAPTEAEWEIGRAHV